MLRFRYARRYRTIILTLVRHGLGWLVVKLGLGALVPFHWGLLGHPRRKERYSAAEHLRMAFEELGPTFIKLAQILSTRPDLISPAYAEEFASLQDQVPARPFEEMRSVLESQLGRPYGEVFSYFDPTPIASASIGQVYRAELDGSRRVVVKIQKPGVSESIAQDLNIFKSVVRRMRRHGDLAKRYDLEGLLEEFAFFLLNELDYIREGQNAERFRLIFKDDETIFIPDIHWDYTSPRVLVMDEIRGVKVNELPSTQDHLGMDRRALATAAMKATFKTIFQHGFFHADPHPGNFFVMDGHKLGLIDFGLVGYLEKKNKQAFLRFTYEMVMGDVDEMMDAMWDLGISGRAVNRSALKRDLSHLLVRFRESSLGEIAAGDLMREITFIAYRHQLQLPPDLALLLKVLAMSEGLGAMLDPGFRLFEFAEPILKLEYRKIFSVQNLFREIEEDVIHLLQLGRGLPQRVSRLLRRIEMGDIEIGIRHEELESSTDEITRAVNRLTIGSLLALLLVSISAYFLAGHFLGFGFYVVNIFLFMIIGAAVISIGVVFHMWREKRK